MPSPKSDQLKAVRRRFPVVHVGVLAAAALSLWGVFKFYGFEIAT
jgi:hypothetical protein